MESLQCGEFGEMGCYRLSTCLAQDIATNVKVRQPYEVAKMRPQRLGPRFSPEH